MMTENTQTNKQKTYKDYLDLIQMVTKVEYSRLSSNYMVDFSELLNIGIITVHTLLSDQPGQEFNVTYLSTAIKWAIRNEMRRRYKWYSLRSNESKPDEDAEVDSDTNTSKEEIREAIYETILSIDELAENDNPTQIKDFSKTPDEKAELDELTIAVKNAIKKLPERQREIIEARFYKNKKLRDLSIEFDISPSRISRVIQSALNKIKAELQIKHLV
jgi:RNA polymerase sigma factor (sigma-70 family)